MKKSLKFEFKRKFIHLFSLLYILVYWFVESRYNKSIAILALTALFLIFLASEYLRLDLKKQLPLFHIFFRERESKKLAGHIYFLFGAILVLGLLDFKIALTALLMTTFGDMFSAIIGIRFGKHWLKRFPERAWEGIIAEFAIDLVIALLIIKDPIISVVMAFTATLVETTFSKVDDNLSIPVSSGAVAQILTTLV